MSAEVVARLVAEQVASNEPRSFATWQHGMLTVFGTLGTFFVLGRDGDVLIDRDEGVLHRANPEEREFAYVQAARRHPELRHLAPKRPPSARTCPMCGGSGEIMPKNGRHAICCPTCNTRGWTVAP